MLSNLVRHRVRLGILGLVLVGCVLYVATSVSASKAPAWRDPGMSKSISAARQKVLSEKIVTVAATAPWVNTGLSIAPGEHLWTDTRSDGKWSGNPRVFSYSDANGSPEYQGQYRIDAKAWVESLIGFVGGSPPTPKEVMVPVGSPRGGPGGIDNPGFFQAGDTMLDFVPKTRGEIWLRNNDNTNYISDVGRQIVKVVITS
ncbi:MAG: hypothetical protein WBQ21_10625 [Solirubrobacteraceae bacterium]